MNDKPLFLKKQFLVTVSFSAGVSFSVLMFMIGANHNPDRSFIYALGVFTLVASIITLISEFAKWVESLD